MSKKNFGGGLNTVLGEGTKVKAPTKKAVVNNKAKEPETAKRGRPKTQFKEITKTSQIGTKENETRATIIINEELLDKVKAIAYWDRLLVKEVINTAIQEYVNTKKPKARPEEARLKEQEANQKLIRTEDTKARLPKY